MKKVRIQSDYNKSAKFYDRRYKDIQYEKFSILNNFKSICSYDRILDLGCGTGLLADYLDKTLIGIDLSLEMCKLAKSELIICGDIDNLPFKSLTFDVILSFTAIQNLTDFDKVFGEAKRVLSGNKAIITLLNKSYSKKILSEAKKYFSVKESVIGEDRVLILSK